MQFLSFRGLLSAGLIAAAVIPVSAGQKLGGTPIGTSRGYNYEQGGAVDNIQHLAFDGDFNTYFATYDRSYTWVGLDLGTPHVIDRVGWAARNDGLGPQRLRLGVIQGANQPDFLDAVPIFIITENGKIGEMSYGEVDCSRGFRYVRFVSTGDSRCNIAELEFYGTPGEGDDSHLFQITNLPTVCVNTVDAEEPYDKEHNITANIIIINDGEAYVNKPGSIRERGNASRGFPKKPWRIKFDKKQRVLPDAPAEAKKWTLLNNYGDKTLMRNLVAFEFAKRLDMAYVPYGRAVDVVLNGEYKGCYQLCDQVEVNKNRVKITEMEPEDIEGDALTGGYLVEADGYANEEPPGEWFMTATTFMPFTIKSPDDGGVTEQYNYIRNYFNELEYRVWFGDISVPRDNDYRNIFDIESFVQHFLVGELSGNTDTYWSTYMYKDRGQDKIFTGPVWDFDIAFDNDSRTYPIHNTVGSRKYLALSGRSSAAQGMKNFVQRILESDTRTHKDIQRQWSIARNDAGLTYDNMAEFVDNLAKELDASQKLNFLRWPIMNQWVHMNPTISGSYEGEVNRLKSYLKYRFEDLDLLNEYDDTITGVNGIESTLTPSLLPVIRGNVLSTADGRQFDVYTLDGRMSAKGATEVELPSGVYIVKSGAEAQKVIL